VRNRTASLAVDLVESLFGKSTLMRRPERPADERRDATARDGERRVRH
jgi:hypothetical protein